jgi:hypothetical protein
VARSGRACSALQQEGGLGHRLPWGVVRIRPPGLPGAGPHRLGGHCWKTSSSAASPESAAKTANKIGRVGGAYLPSCSGDRWEDDLSSGQPGQYRETRLLKNFLK